MHCEPNIVKKYRKYFKKYESIGCRDEFTYNEMLRYGIKAYLMGCLTITLPKRTQKPEGNKMYIIDVHPSINSYIPDCNANGEPYEKIYMSQDVDLNGLDRSIETGKQMEQLTYQRYSEISDHAAIVLSSRLHIIAPCVAMGIPVIAAKDWFDERFGWLDQYIPFYSKDRFDAIDWNPAPVEIEEIKQKLASAAITWISSGPDENQLQEITQYYLNRKKTKLKTPFFVKYYQIMAARNPDLAHFIREKILFRFTIAASNGKRGK